MIVKLVGTVTAAAMFVATPASAVGKPGDVSWGKANVSYASYNADALQCANASYGHSFAMKPSTAQALSVLVGMNFYSFFTSQDFYQGSANSRLIEAVQPNRIPLRTSIYQGTFDHAAWMDVVDQLQAVVDTCLIDRGYQRFRLTDAQRDQLRRFKPGTADREHFLHSLGSNPQVLSAQRI